MNAEKPALGGMPEESSNQLSPRDIERIVEGVRRHGASIHTEDPRMSSLQSWTLIAVGGLMISVGSWGIVSINRLSESIALLVQQQTFKDQTDKAQDTHMQVIDARDDRQDARLRDLEDFHIEDRRGKRK